MTETRGQRGVAKARGQKKSRLEATCVKFTTRDQKFMTEARGHEIMTSRTEPRGSDLRLATVESPQS